MLAKMKDGAEETPEKAGSIADLVKSVLVFIILFMFFLITPQALNGIAGDGSNDYACGAGATKYTCGVGWSVVTDEDTTSGFTCADDTNPNAAHAPGRLTTETDGGIGGSQEKCFIDLGNQVGGDASKLGGLNKLINQILDYIFLGGLVGSLLALAIKMLLMRIKF